MSNPWEQGSEFHWLAEFDAEAVGRHPWGDDPVWCATGRDALRLLVDHGRTKRGWQRVWVPSYLCQEVVASLAQCGLPMQAYPHTPPAPISLASLPLQAGDAVLLVNTFGLYPDLGQSVPDGVDCIEDHTHDPWSSGAIGSRAEFCVASLRKSLPLADGAVLWSPSGEPLPSAPPFTEARSLASSNKLMAMLLKALYLRGLPLPKDRFRHLATVGEGQIAAGPVSAASPITIVLANLFPARAWRNQRNDNRRHLAAQLASLSWLEPIEPTDPSCVPFSFLAQLESESRRDHLRQGLVARNIYTAVLWPLHKAPLGATEDDRDLSERMLSFHCDMRYDAAALDRVAAAVREVGQTWLP